MKSIVERKQILVEQEVTDIAEKQDRVLFNRCEFESAMKVAKRPGVRQPPGALEQ